MLLNKETHNKYSAGGNMELVFIYRHANVELNRNIYSSELSFGIKNWKLKYCFCYWEK